MRFLSTFSMVSYLLSLNNIQQILYYQYVKFSFSNVTFQNLSAYRIP